MLPLEGFKQSAVQVTLFAILDFMQSKFKLLPKEQHNQYRWLAIDALEMDNRVHKFSKIFLPQLKMRLNHD